MNRKTDLELTKAQIIKAVRTNIRLKHSLRADAELNEVVPDLEEKIEADWASSKSGEVDPAKYLELI